MDDKLHGSVRVESASKRIRTYLGGHVVADTISPLLVWENPYFPTYYFPADDVRLDVLTPTGESAHGPDRGDAQLFTVKVGGRQAANAAARYDAASIAELRGTVRFEWDAMDAWFEEDEEVFFHARSPYTRIDILPSSRHVRVELDGVTLAESPRPTLLFEAGLPVRFYLPRTDVRMDLLEVSDTITRCPYKGQTVHFSARINGTLHPDVAWSYPTPLRESQQIAGLVAFYDKRTGVFVDGQRGRAAL